jgi:hypothetical protein
LPTGRRKAKVTCDLTIATIQASRSRMCESFAPGENVSTKFFFRWTRGTPSPGAAYGQIWTRKLSSWSDGSSRDSAMVGNAHFTFTTSSGFQV